MAALHCEMCGGTDLIKQDGIFVCQNCGMKYSVEDAKKMMIEGTVDVKGTVKVDTSSELENLYQIARRAKDDNNSEQAAKYYDMILVKDPKSWEATFYTVYFKAMSCRIADIYSAGVSVRNCLESVFVLIKENVPTKKQRDAVVDVIKSAIIIAKILAEASRKHYYDIDVSIMEKYSIEYEDRLRSARNILYFCATYIAEIFGFEYVSIASDAIKEGIEIHKMALNFPGQHENSKNEITSSYEIIEDYAETLKSYYPSYANSVLKEICNLHIKNIEGKIIKKKKSITKLPTTRTTVIIRSIIFIIVGILFYIYRNHLTRGDILGNVIVVILCIVLFLIGLINILTINQERIEKNKKTIETIKSEIAELEKEMDVVKGKLSE